MGDTEIVYWSVSRPACQERSLVLVASGIDCMITQDGAAFMLCVDAAEAAQARAQLRKYESENPPPVQVRASGRVHRHAWLGATLYAAVLVGVALAISRGLWPAQAFELGTLEATGVRAGQWWRAWTALTLHLSGEHLVANLGGGIWFGILAARQLGAGVAWLLIVTGAASANLLEALLGPASYRSVGASTAVFTALGLMAAHSWRTRLQLRQQWARRWAPIIAGTALLGWLGTGGEGTDIIAHAMGFLVGCACGALAGLESIDRVLNRVPQWLAGAMALASVSMAWVIALARP